MPNKWFSYLPGQIGLLRWIASAQVFASILLLMPAAVHKGSSAPFKSFHMQSLYLWGFPFFIKACFLGIIIGIIIDTFHG